MAARQMRARPWLELVRLPAVFTAPADVLAGLALAAFAGVVVAPWVAVALVLASAAIYCAGMAANDLFDAEVDARERPGRPIPSGRVRRGNAWALVLVLQAIGLGLAWTVGPASLAAVGFTVLVTYLYNAGFKDGPVGPAVMGLCRYGNALIGVSVMGFDPPSLVLALPLGTAFYVMAMTFVSRREVDGAERQALALPFAGMLLGAALPALWPLLGWLPVTWAAVAVIGPLVWLAGPMRRAWRAPSAGAVRGVVMAGIFGIAMINAVLALAAGGYWQAAVAVGLLVPGKVFGRWFYAT
jgi:4-hydroxybenzoate polyprenyltransferase